ncbi:MAG: hypothetical protein K0B37_13715 [Bacteroidales bacterium]|nr:hypothetical protein [Bacteroidales bacterium]
MEFLLVIILIVGFILSFFVKKVSFLNNYLFDLLLSAFSLIGLVYLLFIENVQDFYNLAFWGFLFVVFLIQGLIKKSKKIEK